MAYQYPYDEELRKVPLNPEMIRYRVQKEARQSFASGLLLGIPLLALCGGALAFFMSIVPWEDGILAVLCGIFLVVLFGAGVVIGVLFIVSNTLKYHRANHGELIMEIDTVAYIEYARPRRVYSGRYVRTVYEDFRHFRSGREFKDECSEHRDKDGDEFITAAFASDYKTILCIYRLSDYIWQA